MRRADRLFEIVQALRGARMVTAAALAAKLEVSVRTIYRDVRDLQSTGVPIDGEAGVGYLLRPGFDLPPLMFSHQEIEALTIGARMVKAWAGRDLAAAAEEALVKIAAVVPPDRMRSAERVAVFAPGFALRQPVRDTFDAVMPAIERRMRLRFGYADEGDRRSERTVRPLALHFWGGVWTLAAWCELRVDFRSFRLDRMDSVAETGEPFPVERGRELADFMKMATARRRQQIEEA